VNSGAVAYVAIVSQPAVVDVGSYFDLTVAVEDAQGATETGFTGKVTLALASNPDGATLGGNLTLPVTNGLLTFYGLTLSAAGSGYTIQATSSGFAPGITSPITVVNPAVKLVAISPPPSSVTTNGTFGLTVAVEDALGHLVPGYNGSVTIALAGKHGRTNLHGTRTVTAVNGVASFSGLTLSSARKGETLQVQATASGLTAATTNPFNVLPAAARILPHQSRKENARHRA
jgi:hypothetical protein